MEQKYLAMLRVDVFLETEVNFKSPKIPDTAKNYGYNEMTYKHDPQIMVRLFAVGHRKASFTIRAFNFAHAPVRRLTLPEPDEVIEAVHTTLEPMLLLYIYERAESVVCLKVWKRAPHLL